jgi:RNA polymerase sigma factor (sigma-70 family)
VDLPPFQELIDAHATTVYRFLAARVGFVDADDCFQETYLAALRAYPDLQDGANLRAWLLTIANHKAIDSQRSSARRPRPSPALPETPVEQPPLKERALWALVGDLPAKQRDAVLHRFVADLPYADVGTAMGCSEEAARRSVFEGVKKLRERLA